MGVIAGERLGIGLDQVNIPSDATEYLDILRGAGVPFYSIADFLATNPPMVEVGRGASGRVFGTQLDEVPITFKLTYADGNQDLMLDLVRRTGSTYGPTKVKRSRWGDSERMIDRGISQVCGHYVGHALYPDYIPAPICMWTDTGEPGSNVVGYSLPFTEGDAVRICDHPELLALGREIHQQQTIYLGDNGSVNRSRNLVINSTTGEKRFIDVRLWQRGDEWKWLLPSI